MSASSRLPRFPSLFVDLNDVIEGNAADRAALASLRARNAGEVVAARNECCVAFGGVADFAGF